MTTIKDEVVAVSVNERDISSSNEKTASSPSSQIDMHDDFADNASTTNAVLQTTERDAKDMRRMGKDQQLVRHFRLLSVASFVAIATAAWEIGIFLITPGLLNGGSPALLYSMIWCFLGFGPVYLSMAEMASMAPIAGAQYHWVSEFAPEKYQKVLSYLTGWTSTLAWQGGNAIGVFLVGTLTQVIIQVAKPDYSFPAWHALLLVIGAVIIAYVGNVYGNKVLPHWQNAVFVLHVLAYFALIVPIWVNAPKATSAQVWSEFSNDGGYPNLALAIMVGQLSGISNNIGLDTAAHMSEEVKDAATSVPRAMISIYVVNFVLFFPAVVTLCYHLPDVESALQDPSLYPAVYVLRQSMPSGWLIAFLAVTVLLLIASNIVYLAAVTRDLFAFARDKGFPFSAWIAKVDQQHHVPKNAAILTSGISIALGLIYLGSPVAFYAITSLLTVALLQCYSLSIGCCLWRRIAYPETMPPRKFSLGRWGIPINILAVMFSVWSFFWSFWPTSYPVTASGFNWASVIFVATLGLSMVYYYARARHNYHGPVVEVVGRNVRSRQES